MLSSVGSLEVAISNTESVPAGWALVDGAGGDGTISGLMPRSAIVPPIPTTAESKNPVFDRSTRYHNTGFARASVSETCSVDCQGSFL